MNPILKSSGIDLFFFTIVSILFYLFIFLSLSIIFLLFYLTNSFV